MDIQLNDPSNSFVVDRLTNYNTTAEGSVVPPPQKGQTRVPFVSGLRVSQVTALFNSTQFILSWRDVVSDPTISVDHYNIYFTLAGTLQPVGPFTASQSPATIVVPNTQLTGVTFYVQTVLANGMTSDLASSPTTSSNTLQGQIDGADIKNFSILASKVNTQQVIVTGLTLTDNSPSAGNIAWSACSVFYNGVEYDVPSGNTSGGDQFVYWTVGNFILTEAASFTPGPTVFLIATNRAGASDIAWNKIAGGGVVSQHLDIGRQLDGPNGVLTLDDFVFSDNTPGAGSISWNSGTVTYKGVTYTVSSGNTSNVRIYWQLSSPTTFQSSNSYPALGTDDFLVAINNSSGAGGSLGYFEPVFEIHNDQSQRLFVSPSNITEFNIAGNNTFTLARSAADGGGQNASGLLRLFDGTGSGSLGSGQRIILTGNDGKIQMGTFEINRNNASVDPNFLNMNTATATAGGGTLPAAPVGFLKVQVGGAAMRIPYYNP